MAEVNQTVNINVKTKGTKKAERDIKGVETQTAKLGKTGTRLNSMFGSVGTTLGRLVPTIGLATGAWKLLNDAIASSTQLTIEYQAQLAGFSTIYNDLVAGIADIVKETQEADKETKSWAGSLVEFFGLVVVGNREAFSDYSERVNKAVADTRELLNLQREARGIRGDRQVTRADIARSITELQDLDKTSQDFTDSLVLLDIQLKEFADQTRQLYEIELEALNVALDTGKFDLDEYNVRVRELDGRFATLGRESEELVRQFQNFRRQQKLATQQSIVYEKQIAKENTTLEINTDQYRSRTAAIQLEIDLNRQRTASTQLYTAVLQEETQAFSEQLGVLNQIIGFLSFIPGLGQILGPALQVFSVLQGFGGFLGGGTPRITATQLAPTGTPGVRGGIGAPLTQNVLVLPDLVNSLNNFATQTTQSRL